MLFVNVVVTLIILLSLHGKVNFIWSQSGFFVRMTSAFNFYILEWNDIILLPPSLAGLLGLILGGKIGGSKMLWAMTHRLSFLFFFFFKSKIDITLIYLLILSHLFMLVNLLTYLELLVTLSWLQGSPHISIWTAFYLNLLTLWTLQQWTCLAQTTWVWIGVSANLVVSQTISCIGHQKLLSSAINKPETRKSI